MKIAVLNGPNLNLLGKREPEVYGNLSFDAYFATLQARFAPVNLVYSQSNLEGELVTAIQQLGFDKDCIGIVLNAGGYSHTSVAIADAIAAVPVPVISVHISNIYAREAFRHQDLCAAQCMGQISGLGLSGYFFAIQKLLEKHEQ